MNVQTNTTPAPIPATDEFLDLIDTAVGEARDIHNALYLLMSDLDVGFSEKRARVIDDDAINLTFQKRGIDATMWLTGEAWNKAADHVARMDSILARLGEVRS